ncbi:hypothetical protein [Desulfofundulus thermocisternus]|uniref:hypothetical protein n=1 Tax=Desulfofundulus thermocisternus TaxID=42471 RepID=UPI00217D5311|nr:hypothetical protein [Desulfofundulus thermocisternus]
MPVEFVLGDAGQLPFRDNSFSKHSRYRLRFPGGGRDRRPGTRRCWWPPPGASGKSWAGGPLRRPGNHHPHGLGVAPAAAV